jgi:predicted nucleic acid-binding protein
MFEIKMLPQVAMVDTGVLMRALGDRPRDPRSKDCMDFFKSMINYKRLILIATPVLAEYVRGNPMGKLPRGKSIQVVSFDRASAEILGKELPVAGFKKLESVSGLEKGFIYYDAMIIACAMRYGAQCIVTLDPNMKMYADTTRMKFCTPRDFKTPIFDAIDRSKEQENLAESARQPISGLDLQPPIKDADRN